MHVLDGGYFLLSDKLFVLQFINAVSNVPFALFYVLSRVCRQRSSLKEMDKCPLCTLPAASRPLIPLLDLALQSPAFKEEENLSSSFVLGQWDSDSETPPYGGVFCSCKMNCRTLR